MAIPDSAPGFSPLPGGFYQASTDAARTLAIDPSNLLLGDVFFIKSSNFSSAPLTVTAPNGTPPLVLLPGQSATNRLGGDGTIVPLLRNDALSAVAGGPTQEEVQLFTADANTRIVPLALTGPLTLVSVSALAARNVSALTFQVNTYQSNAWLAGTERTTLADAQADITALTPAQYAAGAELLFKVAAIDPAKAARGIATISR